MNTGATADTSRELDHRVSNGVEVALHWHPVTDHVSVTVLDSSSGHSFELVLADDDNALDVFEHPYAYAAHRGVFFEPSYVPEFAPA